MNQIQNQKPSEGPGPIRIIVYFIATVVALGAFLAIPIGMAMADDDLIGQFDEHGPEWGQPGDPLPSGMESIDWNLQQAELEAEGAPQAEDVYTVPGYHASGGREWQTTCESYSTTVDRCATSIKAGNGWVFNNLTYLPSARANWAGNPLAHTGSWTASDGASWATECDTLTSGRNGCRSYRNGTFNNIVHFS